MNIDLDEGANGRTLQVSPGDTLRIRLAETPTTGFRWHLVSGGAPTCELVSDDFEPPADPVPGRPGRHSWTFRVAREGRAVIELAARRRWEQHGEASSGFRVVVVARE